MQEKQLKILMIGLGFHANRIYLPILRDLEKDLDIELSAIIDLKNQITICKKRLINHGYQSVKQIYLNETNKKDVIPEDAKTEIKQLIDIQNINTVIISCPPVEHKKYILYALEHNLNILVDKPITMKPNSSNKPENAKGIWNDYCEIKNIYLDKINKNNQIVFSCLAQRRYHPAFTLIQEQIYDVYERTSFCPNAITTNYSDGQWRLPEEVLNEKYHGFNEGIGMLSHSAYHFFDTAMLFTLPLVKESNNFEVFSNASYPKDYLTNFGVSKYKELFPNYSDNFKMETPKILQKVENYGELDSFTNISILKDDILKSNISINLLHTGYSKRSWLLSKNDLYKGNGRVRHESHIINQGMFQTIYYSSLQGFEIHDSPKELNEKDVGGKKHSEVIIFRNEKLIGGETIKKYSFDTFNSSAVSGHQEFARHEAIKCFLISCLSEGKLELQKSNFLQHEYSVKLLSMAHESIANKKCGGERLIKASING